MKKNVFVGVLVLFLPVFLLCACARSMEASSVAPDISLRDTEGDTVQLSDFRGKVIMLNFFASWCPPCRQEIPDFVELQNRYADQGFVMVGVSLTPANNVKPFAEKIGINYTVLIGDAKADAAYGPIRSIPTTFLIDKNFNIAKKFIGYRSIEAFESEIKKLLGK